MVISDRSGLGRAPLGALGQCVDPAGIPVSCSSEGSIVLEEPGDFGGGSGGGIFDFLNFGGGIFRDYLRLRPAPGQVIQQRGPRGEFLSSREPVFGAGFPALPSIGGFPWGTILLVGGGLLIAAKAFGGRH